MQSSTDKYVFRYRRSIKCSAAPPCLRLLPRAPWSSLWPQFKQNIIKKNYYHFCFTPGCYAVPLLFYSNWSWCTDQNFTLWNIIEQWMHGMASIPAPAFYWLRDDFRLYAPSYPIWKLLRCYVIQQKTIRIIQALHSDLTCSVVHERNLTPWFAIETGLKQGCMLWPSLFLIALDWKIKDTNKWHQRNRERWKLTYVLQDMDYGDDLWLLSSSGQF